MKFSRLIRHRVQQPGHNYIVLSFLSTVVGVVLLRLYKDSSKVILLVFSIDIDHHRVTIYCNCAQSLWPVIGSVPLSGALIEWITVGFETGFEIGLEVLLSVSLVIAAFGNFTMAAFFFFF